MQEEARERIVRFGVFEADLKTGELRKRGSRVRLQQQHFLLLELLLEHPGQIVTRDELRQRLWPDDTFVDFDHGLNKAVNKLRLTLGDTAENPRFVETLPKRGYRFIAPVEIIDPAPVVPSGLTIGADRGSAGAAVVSAPAPAVRTEPAPMPIEGIDGIAQEQEEIGWARRVAIRVAAIALVLVVAGALGWQVVKDLPSRLRPQRTMMAVLPFANLEGDPEQEYFCDGMTDEMILQLGRLRPDRLGVIARTSAMRYRGTSKRIDEIAAELGVQHVLEGSVRRLGDRVRITARLVQVRDQAPLWADSFERDLGDVLAIQTDVARRVATSLGLELLPEQQAALARPPRVSSDALEAHLKGRFHWNKRTPADLERAVVLLNEAVRRDPAYVAAYVGLADALNLLPWYGLQRPVEAYPRSKEAATRALTLDASSAAAHTALGHVHHYFDWSWMSAEHEYRRALELDPSSAQAHQSYAAHLAELGRFDEALAEMEQARRLDPGSLIIKAGIGWIRYLARKFDAAGRQLRITLEEDPLFVPARLWLGQTYTAAHRLDEAIAEFLRVREISGDAPTGRGELARAYALSGRTDEARRLLEELIGISRSRYVEADLVARVYAGLRDDDEAIRWLERGFDERAVRMTLIGVDPQYDSLRADPRFGDLLERLNLQH